MLRPASAWSVGVLAASAIVAWADEVVRNPGVLTIRENEFIWVSLLLGLAAASLVSLLACLALEHLVRGLPWWRQALVWLLLAVVAGPALHSAVKLDGGGTALLGFLIAHVWAVTALNAWTVAAPRLEPVLRWKGAVVAIWLAGAVGIMALMIRQIT